MAPDRQLTDGAYHLSDYSNSGTSVRSIAGLSESVSQLSWAPGGTSPSHSSSAGSETAKHRRRARKAARVPPEEVSYSVVIESYSRKGDVRGAAGWLEEMASSPFKPNVFSFNAVIAGFARKAQAVEAAEWFDRMVAEGLEPNVISYTAVIDGCAKAGDADGAARWFDDMLERGVAPNTLTYNAVINSCARLGDVDGALKWLHQMHSPDEISYNSAINSCANARPPRPEEAESLFRAMKTAGLQPTASTFTALERAIGEQRSSVLCSSLGIDLRRAKNTKSKRSPPEHRHVRPLIREEDSIESHTEIP